MGFWAVFYGVATLAMLVFSYFSTRHDLQRIGLVLFSTWVLSNWINTGGDPIQLKVTYFALIDLFAGLYVVYLYWKEARQKYSLIVIVLFILMVMGHVSILSTDNLESSFKTFSAYINILYLGQLVSVSIGSIIAWIKSYDGRSSTDNMYGYSRNISHRHIKGVK